MQVSYRQFVTEIMTHLCTCPNHGYTQGSGRWGGSSTEQITACGIPVTIGYDDYDCSSSTITCHKIALKLFYGIDLEATYTGNMREYFLATGLFTWEPMSFIAQPSDLYLNEEDHVAMCITATPDKLGEFTVNEFGGITGGEVGKQGDEAHIINYYNFPWDGILHYCGEEYIEYEGVDNMKPADVWEYNYEGSAPNGNMYNCALDTHALVSALAATDASIAELETGKHVNTGANMPLRLAYMEARQMKMHDELVSVKEDIKTCLNDIKALLNK